MKADQVTGKLNISLSTLCSYTIAKKIRIIELESSLDDSDETCQRISRGRDR